MMEVKAEENLLTVNTEFIQPQTSDMPMVSPSIESLEEYQSKPAHWFDAYWEATKKKYKWLIHKDDYVGCAYCLTCSKEGVGRKSILATMSLYLWNYEYQALEDKLNMHKQSHQHKQAMNTYRTKIRSDKHRIALTNISKNPSEHKCPICGKLYKIRKGLSNHVYNCKSENTLTTNCCEKKNFVTMSEYDNHNLYIHAGSKRLNCHVCQAPMTRMIDLFNHLMNFHEMIWNPYSFPIHIIDDESTKKSRKRALNSTLQDYVVNDEVSNLIGDSNSGPATTLETCPNNQISKIQIPTSYIATCIYCSGRYLSQAILNRHIEHYHSNEAREHMRIENENNQKVIDHTIEKLGIKVDRNLTQDSIKSNPLSCLLCPQISSSVVQKIRHVEAMHPEYVHTTCTDCGLTCNGRSYQQHLLECNMKRAKYSKSQLEETKSNASVLTCSLCNILCENIHQKIKHVADVHPQYRSTTCHECGLIFNTRKYYQHMFNCHNIQVSQRQMQKNQSINAERQFSCTECPLVFTNATDLTNHMQLSHKEEFQQQQQQQNEEANQETQNNEIESSQLDVQADSSAGDNNGVSNLSDFEVIELGSKLDEDSKEDCLNQASVNEAKEFEEEVERKKNMLERQKEIFAAKTAELSDLIGSNTSPYPSDEELILCNTCIKHVHNEFEIKVHDYLHDFAKSSTESPLCHLCNRIWFGSDWKLRDKDHLHLFHKHSSNLHKCNTCHRSFNSFFLHKNHNCDINADSDELEDPYAPLFENDRQAFMCEICLDIFAGARAEERMKAHEELCSL